MGAADLNEIHSEAFMIDGKDRRGRFVITCDHATNHVPPWVAGGDLGIAPQDLARHIAYDVGAKGVALALGAALDAPVICAQFSRLVIDPNRGLDDPTLVMRLYDGTIIPANRNVTAAEVEQRIDRLYRPYHAALADLAGAQTGQQIAPLERRAIVAIHSFTPFLRARLPRPWHVGVLYDARAPKLSLTLLGLLRAEGDLCVGENEPYAGHLAGDSIDQHGLQAGRENTLIELRNDLIGDPPQQMAWAQRLARLLKQAQMALSPKPKQ